MWKIFSRKRSERLYAHLEKERMVPNEQKGCWRKLGRAVDQILIEKKKILRNGKKRLNGLEILKEGI